MCNSKHFSHNTNMKKICLIWQPIFSHKIFALCCWNSFFYIMYLMYYLNEDGKRVYTLKVRKLYSIVIFVSMSLVCSSVLSRLFFSLLEHTITLISIENSSRNSPRRPLIFFPNAWQKTGPDGKPTLSAHPARFSPDDKFSKQRVACKKRFGLLLTQQPEKQF